MNQVFLQKIRDGAYMLGMGWIVACLSLGTGVSSVSAEGTAGKNIPGPTSAGGDEFSTDNLNKQITDLETQIQKLRDQSLELQEKTRAKLQGQLDNFKKQQDILIPRIEQLRDNSEMAWQDIKENIQKAIEDLKLSVDSMKKN
ncbi:MAG: hypothetical protein CO149_05565 [Nitrospirae bacterium CG_4_9_14_3_um_filter_51_5]|nr:MAG: hypothetical protein CO149_05565 [Nitrospirae bacterium CG_4_9_14_3_um_filter_51_5]